MCYCFVKIVLYFTTICGILTAGVIENMATFGENIRALRTSRGYSQSQFAKVINSNQANITAWERNIRMPTLNTIKEIAEIMHVPLSTLLPLEDIGTQEDADRELLDYIQSNKLVSEIVSKSRSLSEADLRMIIDVMNAVTRARV